MNRSHPRRGSWGGALRGRVDTWMSRAGHRLAGVGGRAGAPLRRTRRPGRRLLLPAALVVLAALAIPVVLLLGRPSVQVTGLPEDRLVGKAELAELRVRVAGDGVRPGAIQVRVDGTPVAPTRASGVLVVDLRDLADGRHRLSVTARRALGLSRTSTERQFTVDTEAPEIEVPEEAWAASPAEPFTLKGTVTGATRVTAGNRPVELARTNGEFQLRVADPPQTVRLRASDAAGNTAPATVRVGLKHPGMRAVHMTSSAWTSDTLRKPILKMARAGKIDTIELDIKDESGKIGYNSDVGLAKKIGASTGHYKAKQVVEKLHEMGVRVVGRLVCFRDPVLAEASWKSGHRDRVVQKSGGGAYSGGYGSYAFTNFAHPRVRKYNIDLAVEAARLGFDDILFDYIRRPDGDLDAMRFPGLDTSPSSSIAGFVRTSTREIHAAGAFVGVSVFGIAATRPESVAQDIPKIAEHADYISPMVYPSHWGPGEYGVSDPNRQPYRIVRRSLRDFQKQMEGSGAALIPWLQDFSLGVGYGKKEVRAQIEAAHDVGLDSFLLWNAGAGYTGGALNRAGDGSGS